MRVVVNMACGLANRMFQYGYYLYLNKMGYNVCVDYYTTAKLKHEKVDWARIFPAATFEAAPKSLVFRLGGGGDIISRVRRRLIPFTVKVKNMPSAFAADLPVDEGNDIYILGVFQNARMVNSVRTEILDAFVFSPMDGGKNQELFAELKECESVAIHIRKGSDYQSRIWYHNTCPVEYYRKAVDEICARINHPKFYVFADNPQWVRDNMGWLDYKLIDHNPSSGWGSHFDMQLMSRCRYNIISNSTYSWWAAFLNNNDDKIVVMPEEWFNPEICNQHTSMPLLVPGWITV